MLGLLEHRFPLRESLTMGGRLGSCQEKPMNAATSVSRIVRAGSRIEVSLRNRPGKSPRSALYALKQPAMEELVNFLAVQEIHRETEFDLTDLIQTLQVRCLQRPIEAP